MKFTAIILSLFMLACTQADENPSPNSPKFPPGMSGKHETFTAKIKHVYHMKSDSGAVFQAFVIEWKGSEVVVQDMFGTSTGKVGDAITVMMTEIDMPADDGKRIKVLQFMCMDLLTNI